MTFSCDQQLHAALKANHYYTDSAATEYTIELGQGLHSLTVTSRSDMLHNHVQPKFGLLLHASSSAIIVS